MRFKLALAAVALAAAPACAQKAPASPVGPAPPPTRPYQCLRRNDGVCDELAYGGTGICRDGSDAADCGYTEESHGTSRPGALRNGNTDYHATDDHTFEYVLAGYFALIPCVVAGYINIKRRKKNDLIPKRTALALVALAAVAIYIVSPPGDPFFPWSWTAMAFLAVKLVFCNENCYREDTVRDDGRWVLDEPLDATEEEPTAVPPLPSGDGSIIEIAAQPVAPEVTATSVQYAQEFDEMSDQSQIVAAVSVYVISDQASTTVGGDQAGDLFVEPSSPGAVASVASLDVEAVASFEVEG